MLTVLSWFWMQPGGRAAFTADHVNIWASMVRRHLTIPHRIACVTDIPDGIDASIDIIAPPRDFEDMRIPTWGQARPQCLRRISMFRHDAAEVFGDRFVCMDLDCVISGNLDSLFDIEDEFKIYRGTISNRPYNGSMMLIKAGARRQVYDLITPERAAEAGRKFVGSDQAWISHIIPGEKTWGPEDGVRWWRDRPELDRCRLVFFPGDPKPWEALTWPGGSWVKQHYRGEASGRCLIIGTGDDVWSDVETALDGGSFDKVIAVEASAKFWPGPKSVVATDRQAQTLAMMSGFQDITFCGNSERVAA